MQHAHRNSLHEDRGAGWGEYVLKSIVIAIEENPAQGESKEANNEEEDEEFDPNQEVQNEMDQQVEDIIESAFQKVHCLHYSPSYWSYEICNRKEVWFWRLLV